MSSFATDPNFHEGLDCETQEEVTLAISRDLAQPGHVRLDIIYIHREPQLGPGILLEPFEAQDLGGHLDNAGQISRPAAPQQAERTTNRKIWDLASTLLTAPGLEMQQIGKRIRAILNEQPAGPTPRPWPEGVRPTAHQMADWLGRCTPEERIAFVEHALQESERSTACFLRNHEGQLEDLRSLLGEVKRRLLQGGQTPAIRAREAIALLTGGSHIGEATSDG